MSTRRTLPSPVSERVAARPAATEETPAPFEQPVTATSLGLCVMLRTSKITFFEVRNMTHKPKLVAFTGCSKGARVSSVAAGLAATLTETGDGNVLLVDMNLEHGAAHPYFHGKPAIGIT